MEEVKNTLSENEATGTINGTINVLRVQTGVLNNALKLMDGKYGGAFYVRYICDTGRGCGWLQLIIEYPTGMVQTQLLCKNVCKVSNYEEDGLGEVEGTSYDRYLSGEKTVYKPHITDSLRSGFYDLMRVYERPNMPIPMRVLWQRIVENYAEIPVMELTVKSSLQDVYEALIEYGEDIIQRDVTRMGNGYVLLTKSEVEETVSKLGYSLQEVRTEFALRGLWVTDKNTGGYQKTRKVDKKNCRFYALKTELPSGKGAECKAVDNVAYEETAPHTQESAEIEKLKSELAKMKKERDDMTQIVCERVPDLTQEEIMKNLL
ncbi:MAG: hypothetical protein ACOCNB_06805 [Acetivibrio ethanolgignens]